MERVDALTREVRALRQEIAPEGAPSLSERVEHLASVVDRRTAWWRAAVAMAAVVLLAIAGGALLLEFRTRAEIADANRKLCPMIALLIPDPSKPPPATQYGRQLAAEARLLYASYQCPPAPRKVTS